MQIKRRKLTKNQFLVLVGACMYQCACIGTLLNSNGVFMTGIRNSLELPMTLVSVSNAIRNIGNAALAGSLTALFYRADKRKVMMASILLIVASYLLLLAGADNGLWYIAPLFSCPSASVGMIAVPFILQKWFPEDSGTVTGIAMAFSGIGGVVFNPVSAELITAFGWRWAIVIVSGITVVMAAAGLLLLFRHESPAREDETKQREKVVLLPEYPGEKMGLRIFLCFFIIAGGSIGTNIVSYISLHMECLGYVLRAGAAATSFAMLGNIGGKLLLGFLSDKIGIWKTCLIGNGFVCIGAFLLAFVKHSFFVLCVAALIFGCCYFFGTVAVLQCCQSAYGMERSKKYVGVHLAVNSALTAAITFFAGCIFDWFGSFSGVFLLMAVLCACSAAASAGMQGLTHDMQEKTLQEER